MRYQWVATRVFCLMTGHDLAFTVDEAEALVRSVAVGEIEVQGLTDDLARHLA
jgi:hypothetical protein